MLTSGNWDKYRNFVSACFFFFWHFKHHKHPINFEVFLFLSKTFVDVYIDELKHFVNKKNLVRPPKRLPGGISAILTNFGPIFANQNPREASSRSRIFKFTRICVCLYMYLFIFVKSPGQTKNDTDLKFGTYTPIDLI